MSISRCGLGSWVYIGWMTGRIGSMELELRRRRIMVEQRRDEGMVWYGTVSRDTWECFGNNKKVKCEGVWDA